MFAQTAPAPATPPAAPPNQANAGDQPGNAVNPATIPVTTNPDQPDQQTIQLNPFVVTGSQDVGYQATQTLAGTRIRTNLSDVAASITVIDKQFLEDLGATDNSTLLEYVTNTDVASTMGTYSGVGNAQTYSEQANLLNPNTADRVRGLAAADNARNYFITDIPWDSYDTDRIDLLRGPNSILFGLGSPAGMINQTTNTADFYNHGEVQGRTGSYGSIRGSVDINEDLIHNVLALRIDALQDDTKYQQQPAYNDQRRIFATMRFDPQLFKRSDFHTEINASFEHGEENADRPRLVPPGDDFSAWWRPTAVSASNPYGGLGQIVVANPYDPWRTNASGGDYGLTSPSSPYYGWISDIANVQQPVWFMDGQNGQTYRIWGGIINGGLDNNGNPLNASTGLVGRYNEGTLFSVGNLVNAATNLQLPGYQYGQYRQMSIMDPSIFDFYNTLIDGPTKWEAQDWNAVNVDVAQTMWDGRLGFDLTYDRQRYRQAGEALLGYQPSISIDLQQNFADYYEYNNNNGENQITNPNYGRPFVEGGPGSGSSYTSDREGMRASVFAELRASDLTDNNFITKLFGPQRFNGVVDDEKYWYETRTWQMYANSTAWDAFWNLNPENNNPFTYRAPQATIYLGGSVLGQSSPANAHIGGITAPITLASGPVYVFNPTYTNYAVSPTAAWTVPSNLLAAYNPANSPAPTQSSNPANLVGWSYFQDDVISDNSGNTLVTNAQKYLRETDSYSGSWQGYFWNNALVTTLGWRYDDVGTKGVIAPIMVNNRSIADLDPNVYSLPGQFPPGGIFGGHSVSGGAVLHLNDLLPHDFLPIGVSLTYDDSSNFQVASARTTVYGNPIGNPTGKDKEEGIILSTKDNRFFLRIVKYDTKVQNGNAFISLGSGSPGSVVATGLTWRNVFLYQLGAYALSSENQNSYRNTWTQGYPNDANAQADEDSAITTWNNIQSYLSKTGFFQEWGFTPAQPNPSVDRTQYLTNPSAYQPDPTTVTSYASANPSSYAVTADQESKGYEFDATANLLPNWRISFNAAEDEAIQTNVGGADMISFMNYMHSQLYNADGSLTPAGEMTRYGNTAYALGPSVFGPLYESWELLSLEEGSDVSELRKWSYKFITDYQFDRGPLKGLGVGGGYRWMDRDVIGYPVNPTTGAFVLSSPYYGPSEGYVDLWGSYKFNLWRNVRDTLQLNVYNVGSRNGLIPVSVEPNGQWAAVRIKPVQEWELTDSIDY